MLVSSVFSDKKLNLVEDQIKQLEKMKDSVRSSKLGKLKKLAEALTSQKHKMAQAKAEEMKVT